ncbi:hypothetical protein ACTXT7_006878 [Hymenolepis weldensis]
MKNQNVMSDNEIFQQVCSEVFNCAKQHFNDDESPESSDECICKALSWITLSNSPPLRILGQKLIRKGLFLSSYHFSHTTEEEAGKIQDIFKFWKRCFKAAMAARDRLTSVLICLLNETVALLRGIWDIGAPTVSLLGCIKLLQKLVEIVCYDTWTFGLKPKRPEIANAHLYNEALSLLIDLKSKFRIPSTSNVEYFKSEKFQQLFIYVTARTLYAYGGQHELLASWLSIDADKIIELYAEDDVLLFRILITLLMIENMHLKSRGKNKSSIPSAHDLFVSILKWINFDRHIIIDWLVSPETDCLTYLLAYTKRLGAASNEEMTAKQRNLWRPSTKWLEKHRESCVAWHGGQKSLEVNARHLAKDLQVSEGTIRNISHQDFRYKSHMFSNENNRSVFAFTPTKKASTRVKKSIEGMRGGYVRTDLTEVPVVMPTKFPATMMVFGIGLKVNADADAYMENLQDIVVKSLWRDSAANGRRPYVFQEDLSPFHKAVKTRDWMDDQEFSSSCHNKLIAPPNYSPEFNPFDYYVPDGRGGAWRG